MQIALLEVWHVGILKAVFYPESFLCHIGWTAVFVGALLQ